MKYFSFKIIAFICIFLSTATVADLKLMEQKIQDPDMGEVSLMVPVGYKLEVVNSDLRRPRMISFAPNGDMLIGSQFYIYRFKPPYNTLDNFVQMEGYPHSVAIRGEELFIATTGGLYKSTYDAKSSKFASGETKLVARIPGGFGHSSRTVGVGPDNNIYVSIGISGNCSDQFLSDSYRFGNRRGGVMQLDESTENPRWLPFATGLRNPVDFDWHPTTGIMYAANNGPDHWGFEQPPEYFSKLLPGSFHGMPWFQFDGSKLRRDPCADSDPPYGIDQVSLPVALFPSRNAPLGMTFVPQNAMDKEFEFNAIVALHGSWGTLPDGTFSGEPATRRPPAIVMVRFENGEATGVESVVTGFQLKDGQRWARPADVAIAPTGEMYFTSDGGQLQGLLRLTKE